LLEDSDVRKREKRLWRLAGVMLKQSFASPVTRRPTPATGARYRWEINPALLAERVAEDSWEVKILNGFAGRRAKESVADYALRLKSETNFGRAFRKTICLYVCSDPATLRFIDKALRDAGLGKYGKLARPRPLMAAGFLTFATAIPSLSVASAGLMALAMFILATMGLKEFCEGATNTSDRHSSVR
jgi:hypothetical protein